MQNQIYRGVFHSGKSAPSHNNINDICLNYRGVYFIKSQKKQSPEKKLNLNYRGTTYKKCVY